MKKVLFATTALVASAGIASAQGVEVSGYAEMGISGGTGGTTQFHQDIEVTFSMSGETDNGLTFGASVQLDEGGTTGAGTDVTDDDGYAVYIRGDFGNLTMGDTDGGFDWAMTEVNIGGSIRDNETTHGGFNGNAGFDGDFDGQVVRYDHSVGDFSFAVSVEADETGVGDPIFGVGVKFNTDLGGTALGVGLGYQSNGTSDVIGLSLDATMDNGLQARFNYASGDSDASGVSEERFAIGLGYSMDAITVGLNYGRAEEGASTQDGFGLAANYDLGGGAVVQFGYGSTNSCGVYANCAVGDTWSLGVAMSF